MSVLINMEMPTSCRKCRLKMNCDDCEGWECVCVPLHQQIGYLGDLLADKRREDCPLVPVPSHGRLIDKDALEADISASVVFSGRDGNAEIVGAKKIINRFHVAPTVIEAEEGE